MRRASWMWPVLIICSACAADIFTFVLPGTAISGPVLLWFLFVCPGMTLVRFFHLHNALAEWTLAIALSLTIDTIVAGLFLYAHRWSPPAILIILVNGSLVGVIAQAIIERLLKEIRYGSPALRMDEERSSYHRRWR